MYLNETMKIDSASKSEPSMGDKPKHPGGRPSIYRPEFCEQAIEYLKTGASIEELGLELDVGYSTIYQWMHEHEEFAEAIKQGREYSKGWWLKNGRSELHSNTFNSTLWYMNMKNRWDWSDKKEVNNTVVVSHEAQLKQLASDE
jgi:transposase-like protein